MLTRAFLCAGPLIHNGLMVRISGS
jgi:hypothetical protein